MDYSASIGDLECRELVKNAATITATLGKQLAGQPTLSPAQREGAERLVEACSEFQTLFGRRRPMPVLTDADFAAFNQR